MRLLACVSPGETRVAAWDGILQDYAIDRPGAPDGVGDLHRGRVIARVAAMAGCFVALQGAEGFLPDSEGAANEGIVLGVRVTRAAQGGKGPRLSARLTPEEQTLVGTGSPALLRRGPSALARLAARYPEAPISSAASFDDEVEEAIDSLSASSVALAPGVVAHVFPTPALTAIDIDLVANRGAKAATQAAANRALLPALARQIRLRNLSGAILVDLAGMALRKRAALGPEFVKALAADPLAPRFLGFSGLGLAEILRPRIHPPLHELLATPHAAGLAALRALAREVAATPHRAPVLYATTAIIESLRADAVALQDLAERAGRPATLVSHHALAEFGWSIEDPTRG